MDHLKPIEWPDELVWIFDRLTPKKFPDFRTQKYDSGPPIKRLKSTPADGLSGVVTMSASQYEALKAIMKPMRLYTVKSRNNMRIAFRGVPIEKSIRFHNGESEYVIQIDLITHSS